MKADASSEGVMSRYESSLVAALSGERDTHKYWMLRLKHAVYKARLGYLDDAREIIRSARSVLSQMNTAQIVAYINFAEGVCEYFENGAAKAIDKLNRSRALATGCPPNDDLPLLVAAWLAAVHRILGQWDNLSRDLADIFVAGRVVSDEVAARACLVVADTCEDVGAVTKANNWYKSARESALRLGDDSSLGAILYNRAAIKVFNVRIQEVKGLNLDIDECHLIVQAASAENYAQYVKDASLGWAFDLLFGQLAIVQGQYAEAIRRFTSSKIPIDLSANWPSAELMRSADILRSRAILNEMDQSQVIQGASALMERFSGGVSASGMAIAAYSIQLALKQFDGLDERFTNVWQDAIARFDLICQQESDVLKVLGERVPKDFVFPAL